eukprot:TRINITY_DN19499_c0_g1_i1.p1 TRINITY_DN19499_c0_g1~~TRINITY_DN19499_c0_g1_i1.p1  ORF type:complete len:386 (+),score=112.57 TRINITY_DN19499_c0_g1_i1:47-1159(+)
MVGDALREHPLWPVAPALDQTYTSHVHGVQEPLPEKGTSAELRVALVALRAEAAAREREEAASAAAASAAAAESARLRAELAVWRKRCTEVEAAAQAATATAVESHATLQRRLDAAESELAQLKHSPRRPTEGSPSPVRSGSSVPSCTGAESSEGSGPAPEDAVAEARRQRDVFALAAKEQSRKADDTRRLLAAARRDLTTARRQQIEAERRAAAAEEELTAIRVCPGASSGDTAARSRAASELEAAVRSAAEVQLPEPPAAPQPPPPPLPPPTPPDTSLGLSRTSSAARSNLRRLGPGTAAKLSTAGCDVGDGYDWSDDPLHPGDRGTITPSAVGLWIASDPCDGVVVHVSGPHGCSDWYAVNDLVFEV